jgi:hypothetical protein
MYLLYTFLFSVSLLTYSLDGHIIIYQVAKSKYEKFKQLNKLVSSQYKNVFSIIWVSICLILKMYWINFLQWANKTVEYTKDRNIIISYVINGRLYKLVVKNKRGPNDILLITDENSNDLTDTIIPYMGLNRDWHNRDFSPKFWDKKSLCFELSTGDFKTFNEHDVITV